MQEIRFGIVLLIESKLTQIAAMAQNLKQSAGSSHDGITGVVAIMVFNATGAPNPLASDLTYATRIQSYGSAIGGAAATLGNLISLSTALASFGTGITDANSALAALQNCATLSNGCTAQQQTAAAGSAYAMEQSACAAPSDQASTDPSNMCFKLKTAIGSATPANPAQLLTNLSNYANTAH